MTSQEFLEYLKGVDTPTLCNAIELLGVRPDEEGFTPLALQCIFPELGRTIGYAVTAQVETVTRMDKRDNRTFYELYSAIDKSPKPAIVVLQEMGAHGDYAAHAGEIVCSISQRLGAIALVSDCGVRDIPEVRKLGFQYFARGRVASHANYRIVRVGVAVQVLGMVVKPGDLLHGDENGLALVPAEKRDQIPSKVNQIREKEGKLLEFVRSKKFTLGGLKKFMALE